MQIIKVRAWNKKEKRMYQWNELTGNQIKQLSNNNDIELLLYTGLLDFNGQEIYEGDIVEQTEHHDCIFPVKWEDIYGGFSPFAIPGLHAIRQIFPSEIEIIGNIYEDPDLISHLKESRKAILG